ncbi:alpha-amylase family glycosyl hydrolase [Thiocystis violascens]|uniref:1,4-alpha-glucan branching enzyme n=1 Tax=Thiocystis violascens (strain ATCC 17096 / DSM 198 / 6111) TaxID=765911 RepID=I3YF40_THIV6|nr:alpha-amylase family glycosyl hydrolase [Thiocystis violascens]AFL75608.1 1,4-alpha-glucan branching enzyme [Thiocystis violascens DSM 198]
MYETFGAVVQGPRVEFHLFLPDNARDPSQYFRGGSPRIKQIHVRGDFQDAVGSQNWSLDQTFKMQRLEHPHGWLYKLAIEQDLNDGYYQYKYFVEFENGTQRWVSDPIAKYGGNDQNENSAFVIGGRHTVVHPIARRRPPRDLVIYETHLDDFTAAFRHDKTPVDAFRERLDYLQELGVNAIEFMPWTAWPGSGFSWGYDPVAFFSVENRYVDDPAKPADKLVKLMELINDLHERGMQVIMDGVFNHVRAGNDPNLGFPYRWLYQVPSDSPFIGAFAGGGFFEEFDYQNNCVAEFIRDVCLYWLDRFQLDGIRFDYTLGFFRQGDAGVGIAKLIADLHQSLNQTGRSNVALFIEHLTDNRFEAIRDTNDIGAAGCWFDPFMFKHFEYCRNGNIDSGILRILNANLDFAPGKEPVTYLENHDHSSIMQEAGGRGRWFKTQPAAIALMTAPGAVMLHHGQEFGQEEWLPGSGDGRVVPRPLRWEESPLGGDAIGTRLFGLYQRLIAIRQRHPALRSPNFFPFPFNHPEGYGAFPEQDVVIYHRWGQAEDGGFERFIIVVNYSDFDQRIDIPFATDGHWEDLLNGGVVFVDNQKLRRQKINSNWGRIYYRKA